MCNAKVILICLTLCAAFFSCVPPETGRYSDPVEPETLTIKVESYSFVMNLVAAKTFFTGPLDDGTAAVVDDFFIGRTEVTYKVWYTVRVWAEANAGYQFAHPGREGYSVTSTQTDGAAPTATLSWPVVYISWRDMIIWCNALTEYYNAHNNSDPDLECVYFTDENYTMPLRICTGDLSVSTDLGSQDAPYVNQDSDGFRITTNEEWELAARFIVDSNNDGDICDLGEYYPGLYASGASTKASDQYQSQTGEVAWFGYNSGGNTHNVAWKKANALALYDMSGNVSELCFQKMIRGGSVFNFTSGTQVGRADYNAEPYQYGNYTGFRLARTSPAN